MYLKKIDDDNMNDFDNEKLDEKTLQILDHAMKLEIFNGDFYKSAAQLIEDIEIKKMFEDLSKMEYMHAKVHQKLGGFSELPKLIQLNYEKYKEDGILVELANKREKHAVEYYDKYSKQVCSNKISEIFKALSDVEREHINITD